MRRRSFEGDSRAGRIYLSQPTSMGNARDLRICKHFELLGIQKDFQSPSNISPSQIEAVVTEEDPATIVLQEVVTNSSFV